MGSEPEIHLHDAIGDDEVSEHLGANDLLDAVGEVEEFSEISSIVKTAQDVGSVEYTLSMSEDEEAPEITCILSDETGDQAIARASRSIGHGLRPVVAAERGTDTEDVNVVVKIEI